jgi:hypothetical protein
MDSTGLAKHGLSQRFVKHRADGRFSFVGTQVRNDLQQRYDLQRSTTTYNDATTTYIATLQRLTTTYVERRDAWRS